MLKQNEAISGLEKRVAETTPAKHTRDLIIGSSIVAKIDQGKLVNTDVIGISGGRIRDVHKRLSDVDKSYHRVSIVVGGNDCAAKTDLEPIETIIDQYKSLIDQAQTVSSEIHVGTVLPRGSEPQGVRDRIDTLNAHLVSMGDTAGLTIINNDRCFKLGDSSINDGYFVDDMTHLNDAGTAKLAHSMGLSVKSQHTKNVSRSYSTAAKTKKPSPSKRQSQGKSTPPARSATPPPRNTQDNDFSADSGSQRW